MVEEITQKLLNGLHAAGKSGLLALTPENTAYAAGVVLPFARQTPDRPAFFFLDAKGQSCLVIPFDWAEAMTDQGYSGRLAVYDDISAPPLQAAIQALAANLKEMNAEANTWLTDTRLAPAATLKALQTTLPKTKIEDGSSFFYAQRALKTHAEVVRIEEAAQIAERGFIGALNHLEGTVDSLTYTMAELAERVRVHAIEFDASGVGHLCAAQGSAGRDMYVPATPELVRPDTLVRMEYSVQYLGYWANAARMVYTGHPTAEYTLAYSRNLLLKQAAVEALRPGKTAAEVYAAVEGAAARNGIDFFRQAGVGRGVGVSEAEPPYLVSGNPALLSSGMVVCIDIYTRGPLEEWIHSIDTYELVDGGSRLLSWYKNWDQLYAVTGFRATH